jgi:hypothetical protein
MKSVLESPVQYTLPVGDVDLPVNERIGERMSLTFDGEIRCIHCDRKIKKSFQQGYCYPCFQSLAQCDRCIVKPELCHYDAGTCREPEWGETHCLIPHSVYLSNTSKLKVGVTRGVDPTTRWIDQGAAEALVIRRAKDRLEAGRIEVALTEFVADKTNWRQMLQGPPEPISLPDERDRLIGLLADKVGSDAIPGSPLEGAVPDVIEYPVSEYPEKVVSHNLDKNPMLEGTLLGVKGQYLIFDTAVINVRKYGGYCLMID